MFFKGVQVGSLYHSVCDAFDTEMGNYCLEIKIARIFKSVVGAGKGNMVLVPFFNTSAFCNSGGGPYILL